MKPSRDSLSETLRQLAAAAPRGAPPELGARLKREFALRHARRGRRLIVLAAGLAACLAIALPLLLVNRQSVVKDLPPVSPTSGDMRPVHRDEESAALRSKNNPHPISTRSSARRPSHLSPAKKLRHPTSSAATAADFVALPSFDPTIPIGPARILRVELPASALQLIGYPVNGELLGRRIVTDMLVGQDGVPYGVRLIQTGANH